MRGRGFDLTKGKRAVCSGLFLGMLCGLTGCTGPAVQPGITATPALTGGAVPVTTDLPESPTAVPSDAPTAPVTSTKKPKPSSVPKVTAVLTPEATKPPAPTSEATKTPVPTPAPTSEPTKPPEPTKPLKPTRPPEPTRPLTPTKPLKPTPTPTPGVTLSPEPVPTPTAAAATPTPLPTGKPDYDTLLQNGWQRMEDFFGNREIFFSGKFDETELITSAGRYEYRYTEASDTEASFSVIGEEGQTVSQFLDELMQMGTECRTEQEGEEDYSYFYTAGELQVRGRIYACRTGENGHRMRIELCSPVNGDVQTEGYEFYIREKR